MRDKPLAAVVAGVIAGQAQADFQGLDQSLAARVVCTDDLRLGKLLGRDLKHRLLACIADPGQSTCLIVVEQLLFGIIRGDEFDPELGHQITSISI